MAISTAKTFYRERNGNYEFKSGSNEAFLEDTWGLLKVIVESDDDLNTSRQHTDAVKEHRQGRKVKMKHRARASFRASTRPPQEERVANSQRIMASGGSIVPGPMTLPIDLQQQLAASTKDVTVTTMGAANAIGEAGHDDDIVSIPSVKKAKVKAYQTPETAAINQVITGAISAQQAIGRDMNDVNRLY